MGLHILKRMQRLQGGTDAVSFPRREPKVPMMSTWADYLAQLLASAPDEGGKDRYSSDQLERDSILDQMARVPPDKQPSEQGQRFQGGTENLEPGPLPPDKKLWGQKELAGLYDPGPMPRMTPEQEQQEQQDWDQNIKEVLAYTPDLTPEERRQVQELNPKDWDDSTREKVGQASEQAGKDIQLQQGTNSVMNTPVPPPNPAANPGLRLLMAMQKLRRPQGMTKPRRFPPKQAMPPIPQNAGPPQGFAKGSSGIHIKPSHKGLFTAKAKGAGMGVQQYASKVLSGGSKASAATRRQANFARNAAKWKH